MSASDFQLSTPDNAFLNSLPDGVAYYQAIRNETGLISHFRLVYHNPLFEQLVPASCQLELDIPVSEPQPHQPVTWALLGNQYADVLAQGTIGEYVLTDPLQPASLCLRAAPFGDGVSVTLRLTPTQSPEAQNQWFNNVLNASLSSTFVYETIRDETGRIQDFRVLFANRHAREDVMIRFGLEAVGSTILTLYPNSLQFGQLLHCEQVVETGQPMRLELYYPEVQAWYETLITKLGDGCIVTGLDITDRKQSELLVRQQTLDQERMVQELRQSNENLRQFAQVASHDLQEPLRKIQTFSDILQNQFEDNLSEGERDMTRRIQKSAQRMQLMIKDLLTYSQLAAQRDPFYPVALTGVVDDVISDLELTISEANARIEAERLPTVLGSSSRLRQLMQNLIVNALKFRRTGQSPLIQIRSRVAEPAELPADLEESSPFWLITVADNGLGFDEKYKDRIFHPFQRLHNATYSGTGIGLAICQRVAESHGGAIDVSSQLGEGSTFKIFLPVYSDAAAA